MDRVDVRRLRKARTFVRGLRSVRPAHLAFAAALACGLASPAWPGAVASAAPSPAAVEVSFDPAAEVRLRGQRFVTAEDRRSAATRGGGPRSGTGGAAVDDVLARHDVVRVERVFDEPESSLDAARARLLAAGRRDVPDLNRHVRIHVADAAERDRLRTALRRLGVVDEVIPAPQPAPPPAEDYTAGQRYGFAAPVGIGAAAIAASAGGLGQNVKIVDVEYSWNAAHEDVAGAGAELIPNGTPVDPFDNTDHGTAVLGALAGTRNAFGVTGLAPDAGIGLVNAFAASGYKAANAVNLARQSLSPGDVILLEQQYPATAGGRDYVAIEFLPSVYDAIRLATQDGINVVEAAGNGGVDLDRLPQRFPQGKPDSGAIVVGAGGGDCGTPANARLGFSSHGARVDLQGWGQCVTTTGYGTLFDGGPDALYTAVFNGTSSASAIVAAAVALYSSAFQAAADGRAPSPLAVRQRLVATGTPQSAGAAGHIGPLPNVVAAVAGMDVEPATASVSAGPSGPTNDPTPTFQFAASEPGSTFECRLAGVTTFSACTSPHTRAALADGTYAFEVRAIDAALNQGAATLRAFTVDTVAPAASITDGPAGSTATATPSFAFTSDDPGATFACRAGAPLLLGPFAACDSPHTTGALADGASAFEVRATDVAGNAGPVASRAFAVAVAPAPAPAPPRAATPPDPPAAAPPPSPLPTPPGAQAPAIGPGARVTVQVTRGGWAKLPRPRIACPDLPPACSVTAHARLAAGRRSQIASVASRIVPGRSATIRFRLMKTARTSLRAQRRLTVIVQITARHGASRVRTRTVRLTLVRPR